MFRRTNALVIRTSEGISFSLLLAGPVTRFFAWIIDLGCIIVITSVITQLLYSLNIISRDFATAVIILLYFLVSIGYSIILEWYWRGQTLGKRLLGLRVVDEDGLRLKFSQIAIRNLLRFVDALPVFYLIGGTASVVTPRSQRLGDIAASTVVIRKRPDLKYDFGGLLSEKYNSFREYPHLVARLRQHAPPEFTALALQAVQRRESLESGSRLELFKDIAAYIKSLVKFPDEATFGLTDEQYVRNAVDSLFKERGRES
ncbi:MAG: RDD family protein [Candidatus Abyssobacteria bacterium SURF_5]|uniref:RDD family protein n=1 Tax=Abyssobacteria bacterium (strain SURF_5) TaxID=2093360 RepID=A0A3A4P1M0_ABYX5|nr:MAG: RDD family protein [Candidatus Abyssubacteria bacterium SURF_5]